MAVPLIDRDDLAFTLWRVLDAEALTRYPRFAEHDRGSFEQVIDTARRIAEEKFRPHAAQSDAVEPRIENGRVALIPEQLGRRPGRGQGGRNGTSAVVGGTIKKQKKQPKQ